MSERKRTPAGGVNFSIQKRPGTIVGDRGETFRPRTPPRGVGLTQAPRGEFNFESKTPVGTEPELWRALREFRQSAQQTDESIKFEVQELREGHIEIKTKLNTILDITAKTDAASERRGKMIVPIISALAAGIAIIVAAVLHGCGG